MTLASSRSKWPDFMVNRAGDFMQWSFVHSGTTQFSLGPIAAFVESDDEQGLVE